MTKKRPRRPARARALALGAAAALILAASALAKPRWVDGRTERTSLPMCPTVVLGGVPPVATGFIAQVGYQADSKVPLRVGKTFYARAFFGAVGRYCIEQIASVEVIPPSGVQLAITAKTPVRCTSLSSDANGKVTTTRLTAARGCPARPRRGRYGWLFPQTTGRGGLWELPRGQGYLLDVPLRSTRPLKGLAIGAPSCARGGNGAPCPAAKAGDYLQVGIDVTDGFKNPWVVPSVGLTVR